MQCFTAFMGDADEQAGRPLGQARMRRLTSELSPHPSWLPVVLADETGQRVHLTGATQRALGVTRIAPVYTPPSQRGRGWASDAVAEVSRQLEAQGTRVCLFTDQANPTSNRITPPSATGQSSTWRISSSTLMPCATYGRHCDERRALNGIRLRYRSEAYDGPPLVLSWAEREPQRLGRDHRAPRASLSGVRS